MNDERRNDERRAMNERPAFFTSAFIVAAFIVSFFVQSRLYFRLLALPEPFASGAAHPRQAFPAARVTAQDAMFLQQQSGKT